MITVNAQVSDGAGNVYQLNENIPEHRAYIQCCMREEALRKTYELLKKDTRPWDKNYELERIGRELKDCHAESRKALGECFDEYKET